MNISEVLGIFGRSPWTSCELVQKSYLPTTNFNLKWFSTKTENNNSPKVRQSARMTEVKKQRKRKLQVETEDPKAENMDAISQHLAKLDSRRQDLAKKLDDAQSRSDYETFQKIGNSYLGTILESINLYIDLIKEISSDPVATELKTEFADIVKKGSNTKGLEGQSEWISNDVSPLYEKVRQICACVYAAVAKIDQEANRIA
ncbi:MAG: hypothetical protein JRN15_22345 [Nitrososphaerota archaeon]|nr:hypothetical protein [Nitrososphaerota archaeon]